MHNETRNLNSLDVSLIYDDIKAEKLFDSKIRKYTHRRLSIMKQENIREAAEQRMILLGYLKETITRLCGYCFKYKSCVDCPLCKKNNIRCCDLKCFALMGTARTFKAFIAAHRHWCNKLGFKEVYGNK